jgi:hypothetical protein
MIKQLASDNTFERIKRYYLEENIELSPHDEEVRKRWVAAFSLCLDDKKTDKEAVKILIQDFGVSETVAYRDLSSSKVLFADARQATKIALRYMITQWAIEGFQMAKSKKDFKGMEKMLDRITKANNLDKEDMDLPDPSTWMPPTQVINIDFNFFYSEFASFIDDSTKEEFNKLIAKINTTIEKSPIKNYFQPFKTIDIGHEIIDDEPAQ